MKTNDLLARAKEWRKVSSELETAKKAREILFAKIKKELNLAAEFGHMPMVESILCERIGFSLIDSKGEPTLATESKEK